MKTNVKGNQNPTKGQTYSGRRPENKDDLDSREGEEQENKGDDVTHNRKEKHSESKTQGQKQKH